MRHVVAVALFALVASLVFAPVASAQTKWVRGTVVSAAGDTVVVNAAGKDMTFKVDKTTELTARGAGTAQKEAEKMGASGVKIMDFVKPGVGVEVQYKDVGGVLMATEIHSGLRRRRGIDLVRAAAVDLLIVGPRELVPRIRLPRDAGLGIPPCAGGRDRGLRRVGLVRPGIRVERVPVDEHPAGVT